MFAYHSEDPVSSTEMKYHEFRGTKTILLLNSMDKRNVNETGWKKFTFRANNVSIFKEAVSRLWLCQLLTLIRNRINVSE